MYEYDVISFFIDAVDRYRKYDDEGNPVKGDCARMFEEEYRRLARHPDHRTLFEGVDLDDGESIGAVHDGCFSIDRTGGWTDTSENPPPSCLEFRSRGWSRRQGVCLAKGLIRRLLPR